MPTVYQDIEVRSKGDQILDQITKKLGLASSSGIAMGVAFAGVNIGMNVLQQTFTGIIDYFQQGVEMNREFETSMVKLGNSLREFDKGALSSLKSSLLSFSIIFAEDINKLTAGLQDFIREGYGVADSLSMLYQSELLAKAVNEELNLANETIITTMEVFGLEVESTSYITEHLNDIMSSTGLTLYQINNLLGLSADKIADVGLSFDDLIDIMTALESEGLKPRTMITKLTEVLGDYGETQDYIAKGKGLSFDDSSITSIIDKVDALSKTTEYTIDQVAELNKQAQMRVTSGVDVSGGLDKDFVARATQGFENMKSAGAATAEDFIRYWGDDGVTGKLNEYILALYEAEAQNKKTKSDAITGSFQRLNKEIGENQTKFDAANTAITDYVDQMNDVSGEQNRLTAIHGITIEQHYMELGMIDASYASKIQDAAARSLINTLRTQQNEIDELTRANQVYSMETTSNNLEEMQLQLSAMDHRGRMTRTQKQLMKELERADLELRIKTTENQLAIDKITYNMDPEEKRLELIKTVMGEELFTTQDTYNQEMAALIEKETFIEGKLAEEKQKKRDAYQEMLSDAIEYHNKLLELERNRGLVSAEDFGKISANQPVNPLSGSMGWKYYHGFQFGGPVLETGLAMVHRGEYVVPRSGSTPTAPTRTQVNINIDLTIKNQDNAEHLAMKIGELIAQGYLKGVDCVYHLGG